MEEILDELFKSMLDFPGGAKVNYYFYTAFQELWKAGIRDDFLTLRNTYPGYEVWVKQSNLQKSIPNFRFPGIPWAQQWLVCVQHIFDTLIMLQRIILSLLHLDSLELEILHMRRLWIVW